ncbi:MAG: hypothetical protein JNL21_15920 [Myxococcales bacterium]|nr:hypothetical protein [Myxococcales bacterium]
MIRAPSSGVVGRRAPARRPGFTMIELMVAISTGMAVGLAAFLLAKVSLGAFQQDARVNNAQHSVLMAMNRVASDVRRAGFMTTADAATDPALCDRNNLNATQRDLLFGIQMFDGADPTTYGASPNNPLPGTVTGPGNNRAPDRIRLTGNYMTTERLAYRMVNAASNQVHLAIDTNAIQRVHRDGAGSATSVCRLFPTGSFLRLVDSNKRETYVGIDYCTQANSGALVQSVVINYVTLGNPLPRVAGVCGVAEGNAAGTVNTVNVIEYSVQRVSQPFGPAQLDEHGLAPGLLPIVRWDPAVGGDGVSVSGDDTRLDLIRRQLDTDGNIIPNSGEVIADYVADFKLRARYLQGPLSQTILDSGFDKGDGIPAAAMVPNRVRSVGIRLTTRSKEADREDRLGAVPDAATALDRFQVFPPGAARKLRFARVRTMYTEVNLPNLAQATW